MKKIKFLVIIVLAFLFVPNVSAVDCSSYKKQNDCNNNDLCSWVDKKCRVVRCNILGRDVCEKNSNKEKKACKYTGSTCCPKGNCNESASTITGSGEDYKITDESGNNQMCGVFGSKSQKIIRFALMILRVGAVVLVVFLGALDFFKIVVDGEDKTYKEALNTFIKRLIAVAALIFVPYIIVFILKISNVLSEYDISNSGIFCFFDW